MRHRFFLCFLLISSLVPAQRLANVDAVYSNTAVTVRFTILAGGYCSGYSIWHTADSTQPFVSVYEYVGICGEPNNSEQHSFHHTGAVPNQLNFYKVRLDPFEESQIIRVYTSSTPQTSLQFFPNPAGPLDNVLNLRLQGSRENEELFGFLLQPFGGIHKEILLEPVNGQAQIPVDDLPQGGYVIWLTDGNTVFSGKFIILD
jgi:hypothetical protein